MNTLMGIIFSKQKAGIFLKMVISFLHFSHDCHLIFILYLIPLLLWFIQLFFFFFFHKREICTLQYCYSFLCLLYFEFLITSPLFRWIFYWIKLRKSNLIRLFSLNVTLSLHHLQRLSSLHLNLDDLGCSQ